MHAPPREVSTVLLQARQIRRGLEEEERSAYTGFSRISLSTDAARYGFRSPRELKEFNTTFDPIL